MKEKTPFAVFLVAKTKGGYAATTRAADRGEAGLIGLPGGKVDAGETAIDAVRRESAEEGWLISADADMEIIHTAEVEGRVVVWIELKYGSVRIMKNYKEKGRICPIIAHLSDLIKSGYGNYQALRKIIS